MSFDASFFSPMPDGSLLPATSARAVAFKQSRLPQRTRIGRTNLPCHAYLVTLFTLRGRYTLYLYLVSSDPGTNVRSLMTAPPVGAALSQYDVFEAQALKWLSALGFEMLAVSLDGMSTDMRQATLGLLPFSPSKALGPEPHELPPPPPPAPDPLSALLGGQPPEALLERLRQGLLRA
jgi:hypothetical protein